MVKGKSGSCANLTTIRGIKAWKLKNNSCIKKKTRSDRIDRSPLSHIQSDQFFAENTLAEKKHC